MQFIKSSVQYIVNSFTYAKSQKYSKEYLIENIHNDFKLKNCNIETYIVLQLKNLDYYSLNLSNESNKYIIKTLFENIFDSENTTISELVDSIKNSDDYATFLKEFYYKSNRCTSLLHYTYSNNIYDFLNQLTYDELLELI